MGVVLIVSVGLAALRSGSEIWAGVVYLLTCGAIALAAGCRLPAGRGVAGGRLAGRLGPAGDDHPGRSTERTGGVGRRDGPARLGGARPVGGRRGVRPEGTSRGLAGGDSVRRRLHAP